MNAAFRFARSLFVEPPDVPCDPVPVVIPPEMRSLFRAPLVLGASVSANLKTRGPADRLLDRLELPGAKIRRLAANGMTARRLIPRVKEKTFRRASVVVALDLFFWDSLLPNVNPSLAALERFAHLTQGKPAVLATVPAVTWEVLQPNRATLNAAIRAVCAHNPNIKLLDLEAISREVWENGGFTLDGRHYDLASAAPDGLHLSSAACEYVAQKIIALF